MEKEKNQNPSLRQKLFQIQTSAKTFALTEESEKKSAKGKSEYNYTPGWKIVEHIRSKMDELGVMLDSTLMEDSHMMISTPLPLVGPDGNIVYYDKKEMYVTEKRAFTWVDVDTGETVGPFTECAAGCNGTDKSIASAHSLCERYFLLKAFHFTTRDKADEPDAHDVTTIPESIAGSFRNATSPNNTGYAPRQQSPYPNGGYNRQNMNPQPAPPAQPYPEQSTLFGGQQQFQDRYPAQQPQQPAVSPNDLYSKAVAELMNYNTGTVMHSQTLQYWLTELKLAGFDTSLPNFAANLKETAQARRENRRPILN